MSSININRNLFNFIATPSGLIHTSKLCGWVGATRPELLREAFNMISAFAPFKIKGARPIAGARSMLWEVGRKVIGGDTPNYAQEIGDCQIGGTRVSMEDGSDKNIEDVRIGDYVMTHMNRPRKVLRTIHKKYSGDLYTIKGKGHYSSITITDDHQFVIYSKSNPHQYEWKAAKNISVSEDYLLFPYGINNFEYQYIEYNNKKIMIDEDFATIIGWYLAEGGTSNRTLKDGTISYQKLTFNLGIHENIEADNIIYLLQKVFNVVGVKQYHKQDKGSLIVDVYDVIFATFIKKLIPGNTWSKRIPGILMRSPKLVKTALLRAWVDGDGHVSVKNNVASGCSVSSDMIRDFSHLSVSLILNHFVSFRRPTAASPAKAGTISFRGSSGCRLFGIRLPQRDYTRFSNLGLLRRVSKIDKKYVENEDVYCLEIEGDHSFIANGYALSNCTSFGAKNAIEYVQFFPLANGDHRTFKQVFPPYLYGCARVFIGEGQMTGEDGAVGAWLAQSVMKYGTIPIDMEGCPRYSGEIAGEWGDNGPPDNFVTTGKTHIIKSAALISNWDDAVMALTNGYPISVASSVGFDMLPESDGFHHNTTTWNHNMCLVGIDNNDVNPYGAILNSWSDVHGYLIDFTTKEPWPKGTLRVLKADIENILSQGDSFAYSSFDGFPAQELPREDFDFI